MLGSEGGLVRPTVNGTSVDEALIIPFDLGPVTAASLRPRLPLLYVVDGYAA